MSVHSAGILAFRRKKGALEVLLVHPGGPFWTGKDAGSWSLPKGLYQDNEEPKAVALREFKEETGFDIDGEGLIDLGSLRQPGGKIVSAWAYEGDFDAAELVSNRFSMEWPPRSGVVKEFPEVDKGQWFGVGEARQKILKGQIEFLDRLLLHFGASVEAVIFDLDGVLIDSEQVWDRARRQLAREEGGHWRDESTRAMMGMSSGEWSEYMRDRLEIPLEPDEISRRVVEKMRELYQKNLPIMPGARAAVKRISSRWRLGIASSSNRELIDLVLEAARLTGEFEAAVSSEEVARGKPSPDVYLETASRMAVEPGACVAIEDSANGILSGKAAGMKVVAIPNKALAPDSDSLAAADRVLDSLDALTPEIIEEVSPGSAR